MFFRSPERKRKMDLAGLDSKRLRFLPSIINKNQITFKEEKLSNNTNNFLSAQEGLIAHSVTCTSKNEKRHVHDISSKRSVHPYKKKQRRHKRFKLNGRNLSTLVEQSYGFDESPPIKRDLYLYKEIFSPWEYSQLQGNYFNAPFFENKLGEENEEDHIRKKRFPQNVYNGYSESQFTSDDIEEYINLKTGKRTKQKVSKLEKAFQQLEKDITELAKLKSSDSKIRNKLSLNPEKDNVEVNVRMPSNIEHLDREIVEEVVRVDVPKISKSSKEGPAEIVTMLIPISQEILNPSINNNISSSLKNNMVKYDDKKTVFLPIENPIASYNIKLNKTNQNGEDK